MVVSIVEFQNSALSIFLAPHTGKYYLWEELYPENYKPPSYCNGQCAMLTSKAAEEIYQMAKKTDRHEFRLEDFYYIGILRTKGKLECPLTLGRLIKSLVHLKRT